MTTSHCCRSLLLFGFLVYWGVLRGKCAATISNDSIDTTTKAAANASAARSYSTSHISFDEQPQTTDPSSANTRHSPRARSRSDGGTRPDNRVENSPDRTNDANRIAGKDAATSERVSRGKKKFADDGYDFESPFDPRATQHQGDAGYTQYSVGEADENLDAVRNFNAAAGSRKDVVDVVKKPQGFVLNPSHVHATPVQEPKAAHSAHYSRLKEHAPARVSSPSQFVVPPQKRVVSGESAITRPTDVASHPKMAAEAPTVGFNLGDLDVPANKNEIWKKPPSKLVASSGNIGSGYTKRTHNNVGLDDGKSSLPTTSTAWALASMRTTDTTGGKQWRPAGTATATPLTSLLAKKNGLQAKEPAIDSESGPVTSAGSNAVNGAIKPFVSWSTRLQKPTTEHSKDLTTTPMITPQSIIDMETSIPTISSAEPKLTKTSILRTASVKGQSDHNAENKNPNLVQKISAPSYSNTSEDSILTQSHFSLVGSHRKANASNDIVQNDVGSMFDRDEADYGADQPPKGRVDLPVSVDATTLSSASPMSHDATSSSTVSSTSKIMTLDRANDTKARESEKSPSTTKPSDIGTESTQPALDLLYGDEDVHQPSNMTTIPTLMLVPIVAAESNSSSLQRSHGTPNTSVVIDSMETNVELSTNHTTLARPANSSSPNVTPVSTDIVPTGAATPSARPSLDNQFLTKMSANVFVGSNSSSALPVPSTTDHVVSMVFSSAKNPSFDSFEKDDDDFMTEPETTTVPSRLNLTLSSSKTTTSSPMTTARVPTSSWLTLTTGLTSQSATTSILGRITTASTTPLTSAVSPMTSKTSTDPLTLPTTKATMAPPRSATTSASTTSKPSSAPTSPTTTMGTTPASTSRTTTIPTTSRTTSEATTSTARTTTAISSTTSTPRTTTQPTSTFKTTTGSTTTTTTGSSSPFKPKIGAGNMPGYLKLVFKTTVADICETSTLKENLIQFITQRSLRVQSKNQVMMLIDPEECREPSHSTRSIPVALYVVDEFGGYDKSLVDEMKSLLEDDTIANNTLAIHEIVFRENVPSTSRVIAAIVITSIAAVCFVLLVFLMCAIRSRQKTNYGQRCTPVSVDDYNLDNISEFNSSVRRRNHSRMSRRSYSNPSFDDPVSPSKPLNFQGLTKAIENRPALDAEFSRIPTISAKADELPAGVEVKNRYANVIPLPETRVSLDPDDRNSDSADDYINANYVKGFEGADKFYIACQGPLSNTIQDFWKMVWNEQTKIIIMLTGLTENGVEKCADYMPPSEVLDCHRLFGDYQVTLKKREVREKYVISSLQLKNMETNLWREVTHLWYTNWPAQGVPSEQSSIIAFLIEARAYTRNNKGPLVVHCSPGTGRTGTVIAIDICIRDYESSRTVNVPATVSAIRRCRAGAVQTKEQYAFIYKVLVLYAKKLNGGTALDSM